MESSSAVTGYQMRSILQMLQKDVRGRKAKTLYDVEVKTAFDQLREVSRDRGLSPEDIIDIVSIMCKKKFTDTAKRKLGRCLLPRTVVPSTAILKCLSYIGSRKACEEFRIFLFCWIVGVYDYIDNVNYVRRVYDIIMLHLQNDGMLPCVCLLLVRLTRKEDVTIYRVNRILRLKSKMGNSRYFNSLLSLYKFYCPHLIDADIPCTTSTGVPKTIKKIWTDRIIAIHERDAIIAQKELQLFTTNRCYSNSQDYTISTSIKSPASKRLKLSVSISSFEDHDRLKSIRDISSFDEMIENFQNLEIPHHSLIPVLKHRDLQHLVSFRKDEEYLARFFWNVNSMLNQQNMISGKFNNELLRKVSDFSDYLQEGIPVMKTFMTTFLDSFWDGSEMKNFVFNSIQRLRLDCSISDLKCILLPIMKRYMSSDLVFKVTAICSLTGLLRNFVSVEWRRVKTIRRIPFNEKSKQVQYLFASDVDDFSPAETIGYLIGFVDKLCNTGLLIEEGNNVLLHVALSFYETVTDVSLVYNVNCQCVPSNAVIYFSLFSIETAALSRMCSLIVRCRKVLDAIKASGKNVEIKSCNSLKLLNRYILDVSNSLWRRLPYADDEKLPSMFDFSNNDDGDESIAMKVNLSADSFSLTYHPALTSMTMEFLSRVTPGESRVNTSSINKYNMADDFLDFVDAKGFPGLKEFVKTFIKRKDS